MNGTDKNVVLLELGVGEMTPSIITVVFFPVILIGMVVGGLIYIAFPLLIIGGIIALISSNS